MNELPQMGEILGAVDKVEFHTVDDVFIKQIHIPRAGWVIPQHKHVYGHTSMLATGRVKVWCGDKYIGEFTAPTGIFIKAGEFHLIQAQEDNCTLYCIHNKHGHDDDELEENLVSEYVKQ